MADRPEFVLQQAVRQAFAALQAAMAQPRVDARLLLGPAGSAEVMAQRWDGTQRRGRGTWTLRPLAGRDARTAEGQHHPRARAAYRRFLPGLQLCASATVPWIYAGPIPHRAVTLSIFDAVQSESGRRAQPGSRGPAARRVAFDFRSVRTGIPDRVRARAGRALWLPLRRDGLAATGATLAT